jgi:hypothetical protein
MNTKKFPKQLYKDMLASCLCLPVTELKTHITNYKCDTADWAFCAMLAALEQKTNKQDFESFCADWAAD